MSSKMENDLLHAAFSHQGRAQPDDFVHMKNFRNLDTMHHHASHSMSDEEGADAEENSNEYARRDVEKDGTDSVMMSETLDHLFEETNQHMF